MIKSKEEIQEAAKSFANKKWGEPHYEVSDKWMQSYNDFLSGAQWASQFPSQGLREALEKIKELTEENNRLAAGIEVLIKRMQKKDELIKEALDMLENIQPGKL